MAAFDVGGVHAGGGGAGGVSFDLTGAVTAARHFGLLAGSFPNLTGRALGTLRRRITPEASRDIRREYRIPAGRVSAGLRAGQSPDGVKLTGYFRAVGLRNFGARQTGQGVTASVFRGGQRTLREGAFMAPLLGTGETRHAVRREGPKRPMTKGRYVGQVRQPLVVQYGPTVAQMLRKDGRPERLARYAVGVMQAETARLLEVALRDAPGGAP